MAASRPWHAHYPETVSALPEFEHITMSQALKRSAVRHPDTVALLFMGKKIAYSDLDRLVNRFAGALLKLSVKPGEKVAMLLPNIPQFVIANYATWRIGAVTAMNNPLYTERELLYQLTNSEATILISLDLLMPRVQKILPQTNIRHVIACHINDYLPFSKKLLFPIVKKSMYHKIIPGTALHLFTDLIQQADEREIEDQSEWDQLAALLYTGGTTGVSRGVMLTHANMSVNVQQLKEWFHDFIEAEESVLAVFPFFHAAGFTGVQNFSIFDAFTVVLVPRPNPDIIIDILKKYRPKFIPGVPTIFVGLLNTPKFRKIDLTFVNGFMAGAAPLSLETIQELKDLTGGDIINIYGLTETSPMVTAVPWKGLNKSGTVGVPLPATDLKIVDLESCAHEMPPGEPGEVIVKGPQVMQGYYNRPEETASVLKDGWLYTGDIGFLDDDGFLTIVDRKKDMIVASGYNIYPQEIEEVFYEHPKILEAAVIGVPDTYRGETVKAFVALKPGETLSEVELIEYSRTKLASYKVPKLIEFVDELPKSLVGKILRRELRDRKITKGE